MSSRTRSAWLGLALVLGQLACFGDPGTHGLPCTEDLACFEGLVCGEAGVCVEPSVASGADTGDGDPGDGDGDGDGESGDAEGSHGDGDGDGDGDATGDGDGDATGDGDGDGDGDEDTGEPVCGNGVREGGENCDGTDFDNMSCANFGFGGGMLMCNDQCDFVLTNCCLADGQSCKLGDNCCNGTCLSLDLMFKCG